MKRSQRLFDIAFATAGVALFAGPWLALAAAIKLEDRGPVLFRQERVGLKRRSFTIHKLRTMRDGKVTRVGAWLRATGLDETTQFVDVLRGDMRMVGPRPLTAEDVRRFGYDALDERFAVHPGITGMAQVMGGRTIADSRRWDEVYAARSSLGLDTALIAASFGMNLVGKVRMRRWMAAAGLDEVGVESRVSGFGRRVFGGEWGEKGAAGVDLPLVKGRHRARATAAI